MIATNFEFKHSNITQLKQNKKMWVLLHYMLAY